ncbi:MAG: FAD-dependent oxidoreductase [Pseudomonadota bacterium]
MTDRVVIVGAGVLGSAIGWQTAQAGFDVTLIDPEPGQGASAGSLAWLNASFAEDPVYNRLRLDSMALWRELLEAHPDLPVSFPGAILWNDRDEDLAALTGPAPDQQQGARALDADGARALDPGLVNTPERAVHAPFDGYGEPAQICRWFLDRAVASGARILAARVSELTRSGDLWNVQTETEDIATERVVLAAGTDLAGLMAKLGLAISMANKAGISVRTDATPARVSHILSTPEGDLWQGPDGRFLIAASPAQEETAGKAADRVLRQLANILGTSEGLTPETVIERLRPIPADGRPAIGPVGSAGLYAVTTHSGMTLAPVIAEMVTAELRGVPDPRLDPYRPGRPALQPEAP